MLNSNGDEHKKRNLEFYNRTSGSYDSTAAFGRENRNHLKKIKKILSLLDISQGDTILEIGCGTGIHAKALVDGADVRYVGVDISEGMIRETSNRLAGVDNVNLNVCDGELLPFRAETFDGAYFCSSLHHMPDPDSVIRETSRVLKKGSRLVLMEPNKYCIKNYVDAKLKPVERNVLLMKRTNFIKWMEAASLEIVEMSYFIYTPPMPEKLFGLYDMIDEVARRVPVVNALSIMLYCAAVKR